MPNSQATPPCGGEVLMIAISYLINECINGVTSRVLDVLHERPDVTPLSHLTADAVFYGTQGVPSPPVPRRPLPSAPHRLSAFGVAANL